MSDSLTSPIPYIFKDFLQPARFKVAYGGRGSGKTRSVITILVNNVLIYGWRVMCLRELMESIADSSHAEIADEISRRGLEIYFDVTKTEIRCPTSGGVFKFMGVKASANRLQGQKLKALANFDAAFIDEGESITKESWNQLVPTMRKDGSEIFVCFNPANPMDFIYQSFVTNPIYPSEKDGRAFSVVLKVNYTDNPFFPKELADDAELMRATDPELHRHVYLGEPVADSNLAIIKRIWLDAIIDAHLHIKDFPTGGNKAAGFDVSGGIEGDVIAPKQNDPNAIAWRYGPVLSGLEEWQDENPNSAAGFAYSYAVRNDIDLINVDNIGVGASVQGELRRLQNQHRGIESKDIKFEGWTASKEPMDKKKLYKAGKKHGDMFANLKAQGWGTFADKCQNTWQARNGLPYDKDLLISFPSTLPLLDKAIAELAQPKRESINGKMKVESKKELKKRGVPSHNLADAIIMAYSEGNSGYSSDWW